MFFAIRFYLYIFIDTQSAQPHTRCMGIPPQELSEILNQKTFGQMMASMGGQATDEQLKLVGDLNVINRKLASEDYAEHHSGLKAEFKAKKIELIRVSKVVSKHVTTNPKREALKHVMSVLASYEAADGAIEKDPLQDKIRESFDKERAEFDPEILKIVDDGPKSSALEITKLRHALNCAEGNVRELGIELKRFDLPVVNIIEDLKTLGIIEDSMDLSTQSAVKAVKYCAEQMTRFIHRPAWVLNIKGVKEIADRGIAAAAQLSVILNLLAHKVGGEKIDASDFSAVVIKVVEYMGMLHIVDSSMEDRTRDLMRECTQGLRDVMKIEGECNMDDSSISRAFITATAIIADLLESNKCELNLKMARAFGIYETISGLKAIVGDRPGQIVLGPGDTDNLRLYFTWLLGRDGVLIHPESKESCIVDASKDSKYLKWVEGCRDVDRMTQMAFEMKADLSKRNEGLN